MKHLRTSYPSLDIEVDGGVGPATIETAAEVTKATVICKHVSGHLPHCLHALCWPPLLW